MRNYSFDTFNLRHHCSHACRYCNCPAMLGVSPSEYFVAGSPRPDVLDKLQRDLRVAQPPADPEARALLSVIADPYCPEEQEDRTTRDAIAMLLQCKHRVVALSKGGLRATRDLDLLRGTGSAVGASITWQAEEKREVWEPNAAPLAERWECLRQAHEAGLWTWLMVAPVIEPGEALAVVERGTRCGYVDEIWVEGLTTEVAGAEPFDEWAFTVAVTETLHRWEQKTGGQWRIKEPFRGALLAPIGRQRGAARESVSDSGGGASAVVGGLATDTGADALGRERPSSGVGQPSTGGARAGAAPYHQRERDAADG